MVKLTVEEPLAPVVPPAVMAATAPPTVTVSAELAAKRWAVIWAEPPTVPLVGARPLADGLNTATELLAPLVADHVRHTAVTV
jgi:hypothetical protein